MSKLDSKSHIKEDEEEEYDEVQDISVISSQKRKKYLHSKSAYYKGNLTKKTNVSILQKYKYLTFKKYCGILFSLYIKILYFD